MGSTHDSDSRFVDALPDDLYRPPHETVWRGREDDLPRGRLFSRVRCHDLRASLPSAEPGAYALLGFACDLGVRRNHGRAGASEGPSALRKALASLPLHGASPVELLDCGDLCCVDDDLERAQEALGAQVKRVIESGRLPILLGGGHEIAWGTAQGVMSAAPQTPLGIVNLDAHLDMRPLESGLGHSGSGFAQIANEASARGLPLSYLCLGLQRSGNTSSLMRRARDLGARWVEADDLTLHRGVETERALDELLGELKTQRGHLYVTLCLDAFSAAFAPGVSAPQPLGVSPWEVIPWLRRLASSGQVVALEIAELNPQYDLDGRTARLAASLISEWFHADVGGQLNALN